ncbi:MAG TPA: hypothetical protein VEU30_07215 [Thermoanaerobaculia bacterium]|nr:hypothetical protein [Thermoanaerobaculia bacterium]
MKLLRLTLVCSLLLIAATPSYAAVCRSCDGPVYPYCIDTPGTATRCSFGVDWCITKPNSFCDPALAAELTTQPAVLAEWTVASVEVTRPAEGTQVVTSQTAVADLSHSTSQN